MLKYGVLIVSLLMIAISASASVRRSCSSMLAEQYGQVRYTFKHNSKYDVEVSPIKIKNQCATGHCHLYAWASELESRSGVKLSTAFLDAIDLYHKSVLSLKEEKTDISQGAFSQESRFNIRKMGLVPEGAWPGRAEFTSNNSYSKLLAGLEAIVTNAHARIQREQQNKELVYSEAEKQILDLIQIMAGPLNFEFTYKGRSYNPQTFAKRFFPELDKPFIEVEITRYPTELIVEKVEVDSIEISRFGMPWERAELLMAQVIDSGRAVYLAYNHEKQYVDSQRGIMSIEAFNYPPMAKMLNREIISSYFKWSGGHAVLVVGYQKNPVTGVIEKWKIQNSWGQEAGDKGYFHMYRDYMHMYGWGFSFINDGSIKEL